MPALPNWLRIKGMIKWVFIVLIPFTACSQTISLDKAFRLARDNYPLIKQKDLVRQTADLNISNLNKGFLPQLSINGQATYQSDVTRVDVPIPGIKIDAPGKDQYKLTADINQLIYDGGVIKQQKVTQQLNSKVDDQQLEVELFKLKDRISQLYLSILYLEEQMKQVELVKLDLNTGIKKVEAQVQNGVAFRSNLNILKAELIRSDQRLIELKYSRKGLIETLGLFINMQLNESTVFEKPASPVISETTISRPEIGLFENRSQLLNQQNKLITARILPKTSLFAQGGYGRPALNLLKNDFDLFYIGGVRFNWALGGLYTKRNERQLIHVNQDIINSQRETFLLNTNADLRKQNNEIEKLNLLVETDQQIIELRKSVTGSAKAQLENGVITANDYLREVTAEDQARQSLITHGLQLLQAQINYQTIIGK